MVGESDEGRMLLLIQTEAAGVLGCAVDRIGAERAFADIGFDSLTALELADRLSELTGLPLAGTLAFDYPNPVSLAGYLAAQLAGAHQAQAGADESATAGRSATDGSAVDDREPIAIVGMACRLPGSVSTPDQLWQLLADGRDGIVAFPVDRGWDPELFHPDPDHPGTSYVRHGGFLDDPAGFDPAFFGLSPREALAMDPQQRLMLEICWEALEHAGIAPASLRESRTGIYTGVFANDYAPQLGAIPTEVAGFLLAGNATSVVSGRLAYFFGTQGPALSLDTACSSSLVAAHLAVRALRAGECTLALAGGVTVLAKPTVFAEFSRQRGLATDGRCKSFAAGADGTGWAEGAAVLVLQRLSDAQRLGHPVLAVIRGSAVNQDGASNGLTAPNGLAQQRLIADALADAGLRPSDVDAVEAHGTGTRLGDPIEAQALQVAYGGERDRPLWLGAMKSNIGHTQAAAGAAGMMKMVLALRHQLLPRTLHTAEPSTFVDWTAGPVRLLTDPVPWPAGAAPRRAAVSSFGISGTNAHVILEEAPPAPAVPAPRAIPLLISGCTEAAVREQAERWKNYATSHSGAADAADANGATFTAVAAAAIRRTSWPWRAYATDLSSLEALANLRQTGTGGLAFVFSGQGSQRARMGQELAREWPEFAAVFTTVCDEMDKHLDCSIRKVIDGDGDLVHQTGFTQPALFVVEVALARLLLSWGLKPDYLLGHSIGEFVAAHISGVLSLADACRLVAARGRLMQALPSGGAMVAVEATPAEIAELPPGQWSLAAVNGARSVVLSGADAAVTELAEHFTRQDRRITRLRLSHAFHSPLMDPMLAEFSALESEVTSHPGTIPVVSNLTGLPVATFEPGHWTRHVREPVLFAPSVRWLSEQGVTRFLEVGPAGVLAGLIPSCLDDSTVDSVVAATLRDRRPESAALMQAMAELHLHGVEVDWPAIAGQSPVLVDLPPYPFQRKRFWLTPAAGTGRDVVAVPGSDGTNDLMLAGQISLSNQPWLADHRIGDTIVVPGAYLAELAWQAGHEAGLPTLVELLLTEPLILPDNAVIDWRVLVKPDGALTIYARHGEHPWTSHATGGLGPDQPSEAARLKLWPPPGATPIDIDDLYPALARQGYRYGVAFQGLRQAWLRGDEIFADVSLAPEQTPDAAAFCVHPALLDAALHTIRLAAAEQADDAAVLLPFSWSGANLFATGATALRVRLTRQGEQFTLAMADPAGMPVATVRQLALRPVTMDNLQAKVEADELVLSWLPIAASPWDGTPGWLDQLDDEIPETVYAKVATGENCPYATLGLVQRWLSEPRFAHARLVLLTTMAAGPDATNLDQAAVWGMVRCAQAEHPGRFTLIDIDDTDATRQALAAAVGSDEPQVAIRDGQLLVPRITRQAAAAREPVDLRGTVLVTGGTGALGQVVARHLATQWGVPSLVLVSRKGLAAEGAAELVDELVAAGTRVRVAACDVGEREAVAQLLAEIPAEHPLVGVVHLAGVLDDAVVQAQTTARVRAVMQPKAEGARILHELTKDLPLSAFVLFSSAAAILGSPGQSGYAAANAYLDAVAAHRHASGLPAQAIAWGLWHSPDGMAADVNAVGLRRMRGIGMNPLTQQRALQLFDRALCSATPTLVAADLAPSADAELDAASVPVVLRHLIRPMARRAAHAEQASTGLAQSLPTLPPAQRDQILRDLVLAEAAGVLGYSSPSDVDSSRSLVELGFDSLTAVELRNRLAVVTRLRLPATLVFDYPSIDGLAGYLHAELVPQDAATAIGVIEELTRLESAVAKLTIDAVAQQRLAETLGRILSTVEGSSRDRVDAVADDFYDLLAS